jgi:hypothetical protein
LARLRITLSTCKENLKLNDKSKQTLLKLKDVKYKETNTMYQKNLKVTTKLMDQIQGLHKKMNAQVISISNLNGDLLAKIWEVDMLKKENKILNLKVAMLERKLLVVDKCKMSHVLQLKQIRLETEVLRVKKLEQSKVLKKNVLDHKRKLQTIEFVASTRRKGK